MHQAISTIAVTTPPIGAEKVSRVDEWLRSVLWESILPKPVHSSDSHPADFEIHRLKGILYLDDGSCKIIQAVRDVFEIRDSESRKSEGDETSTQCKIVLIGRGLGSSIEPWRESFGSLVRE